MPDLSDADLELAEPDDIVLTLAAVAAGLLLRRGLTAQWEKRTGRTPPTNPAAPGVSWGEALAWAALTGAVIGVGRIIARRLATTAWRRAQD